MNALFSRRTPAGARWRALADRKLAELEARIQEARRMQDVLRVLVRCECPTLDDCARGMRSRRLWPKVNSAAMFFTFSMASPPMAYGQNWGIRTRAASARSGRKKSSSAFVTTLLKP